MQRDHARVGRARLTYHSEYNSGSILSRQYNPIRSNTAINSAWFHAPGKVLQETLVDHDLVLEAHRENTAISDSPNLSGCDTTGLYISCSRGTPLSGGDYPQKNMAKRSTRTIGETFACRRLIACLSVFLPCLSLASIEDRERAKSGGQGFENYIHQIVKEKYKVYIPTSPQEFYKFILSILWQEKRRRNEPRPRDLRARCALCKPRRERYTLAREISQRHRTCNKGRPGPTIR